jgi:hypothetical protein
LSPGRATRGSMPCDAAMDPAATSLSANMMGFEKVGFS